MWRGRWHPGELRRFDPGRLTKLDAFFARHGGKAIVLARFVGFMRALAPFVAGAAGMPYPRFLLFNVVGAWLWALTFIVLGCVLGESWWVTERRVGRLGLISAVVVLALVWFGFRRVRRER